jgi:hypothetical protein
VALSLAIFAAVQYGRPAKIEDWKRLCEGSIVKIARMGDSKERGVHS